MQKQQQAPEQKAKREYNFKPGRSGNPAGRLSNAAQMARVQTKARELAVEFGGLESLSAAKRALIEQAAMLLIRRPRTSEDVVRHANAVTKILRTIGVRPDKPAKLGTGALGAILRGDHG
jgi:hypothetical protein